MKPCGCDFCNDLRNIEPAKYIGGGSESLQKFIEGAKKEKAFIYHYPYADGTMLKKITECPECGYTFTEEDYDSYD